MKNKEKGKSASHPFLLGSPAGMLNVAPEHPVSLCKKPLYNQRINIEYWDYGPFQGITIADKYEERCERVWCLNSKYLTRVPPSLWSKNVILHFFDIDLKNAQIFSSATMPDFPSNHRGWVWRIYHLSLVAKLEVFDSVFSD